MNRLIHEWLKVLGKAKISLSLALILISIWAGQNFFTDTAESVESQILEKFQKQIPSDIGSVFLMIYKMSGVHVTGVLVISVLCFLGLKRFWPDLICLALGTAGILVIVDGALKPWFNRPRPDGKLLALGGPSFPSGHAAGSVVFYFMSCTLLASHYPRLRLPMFILSTLWVSLVWISTLYCRAHWPSDILAGSAVGYLWLSYCLAGLTVWERHIKHSNSSKRSLLP